MISIELIFPLKDKRICARVDETMSIGDLRKNLARILGLENGCIVIPNIPEGESDDMTLKDAGMHNGSGVIIDDV